MIFYLGSHRPSMVGHVRRAALCEPSRAQGASHAAACYRSLVPISAAYRRIALAYSNAVVTHIRVVVLDQVTDEDYPAACRRIEGRLDEWQNKWLKPLLAGEHAAAMFAPDPVTQTTPAASPACLACGRVSPTTMGTDEILAKMGTGQIPRVVANWDGPLRVTYYTGEKVGDDMIWRTEIETPWAPTPGTALTINGRAMIEAYGSEGAGGLRPAWEGFNGVPVFLAWADGGDLHDQLQQVERSSRP